ncbi:elongation of very long chain fatty acids protein AAEL008004-like isoform X2 [Corvus cornix cornix]|uniref:elongation of very long chain fatty acids protein AAEL008004-like isoform X2 n=1 Tax=Corvus cornix cornix TaxID=932674 RepID=UPI000901900D|nr:elongation of very long chain fatty acids protein AAEL008004-like isoform X2 [Corvus cornix cornix]
MYSPALWRRKLSAVCSFLSRCLFLRRDWLGTALEREMLGGSCGELPSAIENISLLKERREEEDHHNITWDGFNLAENSRNSTTGESGGPRTDLWPLVYSPLPPLCGGTGALLHAAAEAAGAAGSAGRLQPGCGGTIQLHVLRGSGHSVLASYRYLCQAVDHIWSELGMRVLILGKKQEQVTFLHVYHHGSMLFSWWSGVKYVPGGQAFFTGMLNSFVHIFMYDHYALASLGPRKRQHVWWKDYLTILQLGFLQGFIQVNLGKSFFFFVLQHNPICLQNQDANTAA